MPNKKKSNPNKSTFVPQADIDSMAFSSNTSMFGQGILQDLKIQEIQRWLANPEDNQEKLENLAIYYAISNGDYAESVELSADLPSLNFNINCFEQTKSYRKDITLLKKQLHKISHKELTSDLIKQAKVSGTVVGIWLGEGENIYPYIFDDLEHFFPAVRVNGEWEVWCNLSYFDNLSDESRQIQFDNFSPYITEKLYKTYQNNMMQNMVKLPVDKTFVLRWGTVKRNQRFGIPDISQSIYELLHKKKLKDLEKAVANKIIKTIAILKIGDEKNPNLTMNKGIKQGIHNKVKEALETNTVEGISLMSIPEFAELIFPSVKSDALDPKKFDNLSEDIQNSLGYAKGLLTGNSGNFASNKLSLQIFYKKLGRFLEQVEKIYNKMFNLVLKKDKLKGNYYMEYDKEMPLDNKDKINTLLKLESQGYSIKPILDMMGVPYEEFIDQSIYEIETLNLREKILPPQSTYTMSGKGENGKPVVDNPEDNTIDNQNIGGNQAPKAGI